MIPIKLGCEGTFLLATVVSLAIRYFKMFWLSFTCLASLTMAQSTANPQNATAFSLLYGYPLLAWQRAFVPIIDAVGVNSWSHARALSTASSRSVVKPNVDTLYSRFIYDLSQSNVEVTIPAVPAEELKLFSFYDPFGDNYANIGTGGVYRPGKYLLRPYDRPGGSPEVGLQIDNGSSSGYAGTVSSPTLYGILLVRWGVNSTNSARIHEWQNQCEGKVLAATKNLTNTSSPTLQSLVDIYKPQNSPAENVMDLLAKYAPSNGPYDQFESAGISNGSYTAVSSVNLTAANTTSVDMAKAAAVDPRNINPENNDWTVLSPKYIGVYGTNYALRTLIANTAYLALANPYAVYPTWSNTSSGNANGFLHLASNEAILFTFSGKPPLQEAGFWSLTAYGSDYFLIPNDRGVYALGDRSNLTYSDGTRVYQTSQDMSNSDRAFQILLQPADVAPPANWTNNWLPAPPGGGRVIAQLRFFIAKESLIDGSYEFPLVEKISAIRNESAGSTSDGEGTSAGYSIHTPATLPWIAVLGVVVCIIGGTFLI
jgi:hypothetical protein